MTRFQELFKETAEKFKGLSLKEIEKICEEEDKAFKAKWEDYRAKGGKFITEEDIESGHAGGGWLD